MRSEKHLPPLPLLLAICCLGTLHPSSGFPQSVPSYMEALDIPESEIPSFVMDLCSSIYNRMKVNEDSSGIVGRPFFLFRPRNGRKVSINEH
uniref:Isoform 5 of Neuromedin-S n=1 Tax=Bombina orientalis TaxID=8346 RepID=Q1HA20-5|nr:nms-17 protein [Bombina orientalis]